MVSASFPAAIFRNGISFHSGSESSHRQRDSRITQIMKPHLIQAASEVIPNQQILVNMVSRRVRQLYLGHRPMVEFVPGFGHADIALSEIAAGKLVFESTLNQNGKNVATQVVEFPGILVAKTKKKAAA
jgi:DNA-directed RNA polymerase subunit omega